VLSETTRLVAFGLAAGLGLAWLGAGTSLAIAISNATGDEVARGAVSDAAGVPRAAWNLREAPAGAAAEAGGGGRGGRGGRGGGGGPAVPAGATRRSS
jgi:hypothetical protein